MPLILLLILTVVAPLSCAAEEVPVGRFSTGDLAGWSDKIFSGKTGYSLVNDGGRTVLKAHSKKAASGFIKKVKLDTRKFPLLRWSWKVERTNSKEDIRIKAGDDFAARVYVIFPRTFFWQMRAINYVWAAKMPKDSHVPSPYTGNAIIVAVESGDESAGAWVCEERNIREDYLRFFHEEPPELGGVAIMTDTDNTGEESTAWYGDIQLVSAPK